MPDVDADILIVDDDRIILESLAEFLRLEGYAAETAVSLAGAVTAVNRKAFDIVITDVNMPAGNGFELLRHVRKQCPETVVIMMTGYGTIESAVEAIKMGAYDYLTKPIIDDELKLGIERALSQQCLIRENRRLRKQLDMRYGLDSVIGQGHRMLKVFDLIEAVAKSKVNVLLLGSSGTGKSLVARVIHQQSDRYDKPFIEVNCGAIPETLLESEPFGHARGAFTGAVATKDGKFTVADGGTIFLDEISTASPALQIKLLRVLQSHEFEPVGSNKTQKVDVRVLLASNVDLEAEVESGRFRKDLYYRINVVSIEMPALVDRIADVPLLAKHFLEHYCMENGRDILGIEEEAMGVLLRYDWPGNIRELENVMERAVVLTRGPYVTEDQLPEKLLAAARRAHDSNEYTPTPLKLALEGPERRILEAALRANNWNRQVTAEQLEINRTTLYKKMKRYGLDVEPSPAVVTS